MEGEQVRSVVVDIGSGTMKAGLEGDNAPRAEIPSLTGRPRHTGDTVGMGQKDSYVGDEAWNKRGILILRKFIDAGIVNNWDDMERALHQIFYNELRIAPEEQPVLLSRTPNEPLAQREKFAQILFESFSVPAYLPYSKGGLAIISTGRMSGISIDMGEDSSTILPVYEGHGLSGHCLCQDVGGQKLTEYFVKVWGESLYGVTPMMNKEIGDDMKRKLSYVAMDFDSEMELFASSSAGEMQYELPDGQVVTIGNERFKCAEPIFQPSFLGKETAGLHELLAQVINGLDSLENIPEMLTGVSRDSILSLLPSELVTHIGKFSRSAKDIWRNHMGMVVLTGGSSMFLNLAQRLSKELKPLVPDLPLKIRAPPEAKYSVWIGGSIIASMSTFQQRYITKDEYDELGPTFAHWKGLY